MGNTSEGSSSLFGSIGRGGTLGYGGALGRGQSAGNSGASATRFSPPEAPDGGASFQVGRAMRHNKHLISNLRQAASGQDPISQFATYKEIAALSSPTSGTTGLIEDSQYGPVMSEYGRKTGYRGNLGSWQSEQARKRNKGPQSGRRLEESLNAYHDKFFPAAEA